MLYVMDINYFFSVLYFLEKIFLVNRMHFYCKIVDFLNNIVIFLLELSRASDKCQKEKRKTINGDDLLWAMATLGFEDYIEPLKVYLARYREVMITTFFMSAFSCDPFQTEYKLTDLSFCGVPAR